jgi:hypothetical protein
VLGPALIARRLRPREFLRPVQKLRAPERPLEKFPRAPAPSQTARTASSHSNESPVATMRANVKVFCDHLL